MTKLAYLDCPTGISGDMCLGALIDAGVPIDYLTQSLQSLGLQGEFNLKVDKIHHNGQQATKLTVELLNQTGSLSHTHTPELSLDSHPHHYAGHHHAHSHHYADHPHHHHSHHHADYPHHHHAAHSPESAEPTHGQAASPNSQTRNLPDIVDLIQTAQLPDRVTAWSLAIFRQLAVAEGAVHGIAPEEVHFHEVGAVDAIVDIVGTCLGLDWLGVEALYCSALPIGGGTIWAAHGQLPVPVPAVLKLFESRQVPIYHNGIDRELVTPTGAAIVTVLAQQFGPPPPMTIHKVGLGAGSLQLTIPNMVRLWLGESWQSGGENAARTTPLAQPTSPSPSLSPTSPVQTTIAVLETQIDDLNPQAVGYLFEALLSAGALDVFTQAIGMKKSRPGTLITVICQPDNVGDCERILFQETTTLGIRKTLQTRTELAREWHPIQLEHGIVRLKVAKLGETVVNVQPEYEDCAVLARQFHLPWREVHRLALAAWFS
ncbi:MAG: TIGR00299 family protein [Alkalinema sp. CACIAM 70d]|nr:MAG: TIGR00299 family protein [Alkalinema sp. CACIAM 70d]